MNQARPHINCCSIRVDFGLALALLCGCPDTIIDVSPTPEVYTGEKARSHVFGGFSDSSSDFYVLDAGNFGGTIYYASFTCATLEDCWTAAHILGAPAEDKFRDSIRSGYAVNIQGPAFYWLDMDTDSWRLDADAKGFSYETAQGNERMEFWAIDADAKRVYYHRESGGFPTDPPEEAFRVPPEDPAP